MTINKKDEIYATSSKVVYQNRWISVREDQIARDDGYEGIYGVIDKADFVVVIPIEDDHVYLVEQFRYPVKGRHKELPQGTKEDIDKFVPIEVAKAELLEECGLVAKNWQFVGEQFLAYGLCSQSYHIFIASDFTQHEQNLDLEEAGLTVEKVPISKFVDMILTGEIKDSVTVNAFGLAKLHNLL